jgi:hypothetical protein
MQTTDRRICIIINKQQTTTTLLFLKGNHLFQEPCMKNAARVCVAAIFPIYASSLLHSSS